MEINRKSPKWPSNMRAPFPYINWRRRGGGVRSAERALQESNQIIDEHRASIPTAECFPSELSALMAASHEIECRGSCHTGIRRMHAIWLQFRADRTFLWHPFRCFSVLIEQNRAIHVARPDECAPRLLYTPPPPPPPPAPFITFHSRYRAEFSLH